MPGPELPFWKRESMQPRSIIPRALDSHLQLKMARLTLLQALRDGDIGPVIVLSGGSGAGKSHLSGLLAELGCSLAERLISRPKRSCDPETDVCWSQAEKLGLGEVLLSYSKHNGHYGVPTATLKQVLSKNLGPVFIVGDLGKVSPYNHALDLAAPLVPRINVRLDVPEAVMAERLANKRGESFSGEALQRTLQNRILSSWEHAQHRTIKELYELHVVMNLTADEHTRLGYADTQLRPLDQALASELLKKFKDAAVWRSQLLATDLLTERCLHSVRSIPAPVLEVLEMRIVPALESQKIQHFAIKGGLAAAAYVDAENLRYQVVIEGHRLKGLVEPLPVKGSIERPVSLDIDWAIGTYAGESEHHIDLVRHLSRSEVSFKDFLGKPIFNSRKCNATVQASCGTEIELDAIALSRVRPASGPFCFEFPFDEYLAFHSRKVALGSTSEVCLVPPEMLIFEKLVAGRGAELGKLDLFDAVALLATQPINLDLFHHMVSIQQQLPGFDAMVDVPQPSTVEELCRVFAGFAISHAELKCALLSRCLAGDAPPLTAHSLKALGGEGGGTGASSAAQFAIDFEWTTDNLKRIALIDVALRNVDRCLKGIASGDPQFSQVVDACGNEAVQERLRKLRDYFMYLGGYQIGRPDVFIRREPLGAVRVAGWEIQ